MVFVSSSWSFAISIGVYMSTHIPKAQSDLDTFKQPNSYLQNFIYSLDEAGGQTQLATLVQVGYRARSPKIVPMQYNDFLNPTDPQGHGKLLAGQSI